MSKIYDHQSFRDDFLPWLKTSLRQNTPRHHDPSIGFTSQVWARLSVPSTSRRRAQTSLQKLAATGTWLSTGLKAELEKSIFGKTGMAT